MLGLNLIQKLLVITSFFSISISVSASYFHNNKRLKYKTSFSSCPSESAGKFSIKMIKLFEETESLRELKKKIVENRMEENFFLDSYKITYSPVDKVLNLELVCPEPLLRVDTVPVSSDHSSFESILVAGGKLLDPTYEMLLIGDKKIKNSLPQLSISENNLNLDSRMKLSSFVKGLDGVGRKYLSEVIVSESKDLTVIFSYKDRPTSVFIGKEQWPEKNEKLLKLLKYMLEKEQLPTTINMTNLKKVVVKFAHKK